MKISVTEYAKIRGITRQAVLKQIINGRVMPHIKKVIKVGQTYVLEYQEFINNDKNIISNL